MEAYLEGNEPDVATLKKLIRKGTLNFSFVPVLCGSAFKNKGVQPLLDAVVDYLPSPLDVPPIEGLKLDGVTAESRPPSDDAPFSALAFKIMNDPFVGTLTFARIYSGKLETASTVTELGQGQEGEGRPHAADACQRPRGHQGSLCRRHRRPGGPQGHHHRRHALRRRTRRSSSSGWNSPSRSSRSRSSRRPRPTRRRWASRSTASRREDPSFRVSTDHESGQTIIKGMGELHLEIIVDRMKREFKVEANVGAPQVAYRESSRRRSTSTTPTRSSRAARASSAAIKFTVEPGERGPGFSLRRRGQGRQRPEGIYPVGREGHPRDRRRPAR